MGFFEGKLYLWKKMEIFEDKEFDAKTSKCSL